MPAQTCNRIDLALEQMELAITLFLDAKSFASVITLASAAERVMGQALRHAGHEAVLDWTFMVTAPVHGLMHGVALKKGDYVDTQNRISNALRHFDEADPPCFEADLEEAACWMLVRACENAQRLGRPARGFDTFNEWFYQHVVGV